MSDTCTASRAPNKREEMFTKCNNYSDGNKNFQCYYLSKEEDMMAKTSLGKF